MLAAYNTLVKVVQTSAKHLVTTFAAAHLQIISIGSSSNADEQA